MMFKNLLKQVNEQVEGEGIVKEIDWDALGKLLSSRLLTTITVVPEVSNKGYIRWLGKEELVKEAGVLFHALESVKIGSFSSSSVDEVNQTGKYWCTFGFVYKLRGGGSNWLIPGDASYNLQEKAWRISWK